MKSLSSEAQGAPVGFKHGSGAAYPPADVADTRMAAGNLGTLSSSLPSPNTKPPRIFWDYDERSAFALTYAELETTQPRLTAVQRIDAVQNELVAKGLLKPHRRRAPNASSILHAKELAPMLQKARDDLGSASRLMQRDSLVTHGLASPTAPASPGISLLASRAPAGAAVQQNGIPSTLETVSGLSSKALLRLTLGTFFAEVLSEETAQDTFRSIIKDALAGVVAQQEVLKRETAGGAPVPTSDGQATGAPPPLPRITVFSGPSAHTGPALKKVLVVGLLGSQQSEVESTYGHKFDLRLLSQEDSAQRMEQNAKSCEITIGMVGYLSHNAEKHLKKTSPDYKRCNGTVGDLKRMLHGLAGEAPNHAVN